MPSTFSSSSITSAAISAGDSANSYFDRSSLSINDACVTFGLCGVYGCGTAYRVLARPVLLPLDFLKLGLSRRQASAHSPLTRPYCASGDARVCAAHPAGGNADQTYSCHGFRVRGCNGQRSNSTVNDSQGNQDRDRSFEACRNLMSGRLNALTIQLKHGR